MVVHGVCDLIDLEELNIAAVQVSGVQELRAGHVGELTRANQPAVGCDPGSRCTYVSLANWVIGI